MRQPRPWCSQPWDARDRRPRSSRSRLQRPGCTGAALSIGNRLWTGCGQAVDSPGITSAAAEPVTVPQDGGQ
jgi:hypothetical protein